MTLGATPTTADILAELQRPGTTFRTDDADVLALAGKTAGQAVRLPDDFAGKAWVQAHRQATGARTWISHNSYDLTVFPLANMETLNSACWRSNLVPSNQVPTLLASLDLGASKYIQDVRLENCSVEDMYGAAAGAGALWVQDDTGYIAGSNFGLAYGPPNSGALAPVGRMSRYLHIYGQSATYFGGNFDVWLQVDRFDVTASP